MPAAGSPMPHDRREDLQNGRGHDRGPEVVTVWAAGGEDLNTKYGAGNANELANGRPMVKPGTVGGCARYGGVQGVTFEYHYLNVLEEDAADNEVVRIVIEDTIDGDGNGVRRTVWGLNNEGRHRREVTIIDPSTRRTWDAPEDDCTGRLTLTSSDSLNRVAID